MNSLLQLNLLIICFFYGIQNFLSRKFISNIYVYEKKITLSNTT